MNSEEKFKNAWHNVRGATTQELAAAEAEALERYKDILEEPHHRSKTHPPLSKDQRAAQFSPFAALTGYEKAIEATASRREEEMERTRGLTGGEIEEAGEEP